jgi:iron complex transport system ATP-binding protein
MHIDSDLETGIRAEDLEVRYSQSPVLRGVSFALKRGESVAVVGPNGAGKSTLLSAICGTISPSRGRVSVDGRLVSGCGRKEVARLIAVVPQKLDIGFGLSVQDVVMLGRTPHVGILGAPGAADRDAVSCAMRDTDIAHLARRRFSTLSGGEQQRTVLAMALAQETPYLLLDEPTVHLDLGQQWRLMETLQRLKRGRRVGVLAIVHDLSLAATYFDAVVLLHRGRVAGHGHPSIVLTAEAVSSVFGVPVAADAGAGSVSIGLDRPTTEVAHEKIANGDVASATAD